MTVSAKIGDLELFKQVLTASCYDESAWRFEDVFAETQLSMPAVEMSNNRRRKLQLKLRLGRWLAKRGYRIIKEQPFDREQRETGNDWPLFGYTMVGHRRLDNIQNCIETVLNDDIEGDIIETGVWRGGAMMFAKATLRYHGANDRTVWCADSFQGLPKKYGRDARVGLDPDLVGNSHLGVSVEDVRANFERFDLLDENVQFLKGWFKDTLHTAPVEKIAVARLDGDLFESTMDALNALYHRVTPGGFVIIDDYGSWRGCSDAVNEFREKHGISEPMQKIDVHGYFWRVPL